MYSISLKRYTNLRHERKTELRIYLYKNLKMILGSFNKNKFFINFYKLIGLLQYGLNLGALIQASSRNLKSTSLIFIIGVLLQVFISKGLNSYLRKHPVGRAFKKRLLKNLRQSNFSISSKTSLHQPMQHVVNFCFSKRWQ